MKKVCWSTSFRTLKAMMHKEVLSYTQVMFGSIINLLVWALVVITAFTFLTPDNAIAGISSFGLFMLASCSISNGLFEIIGSATMIVSDITGDRTIGYDLSLPIPQWMIFIKVGLANAYKSLIPSLFILPVGMGYLYLLKGVFPSQMSVPKMLLLMFISNLMYGFLGLFVSSLIPTVREVRNVWMRYLFPLFFLGGFNFSLSMVYAKMPGFARVLLANPVTYTMEGMRSAMFNSNDFLNYWLCIGVISAWTVVFAYFGTMRFLKRLDCI